MRVCHLGDLASCTDGKLPQQIVERPLPLVISLAFGSGIRTTTSSVGDVKLNRVINLPGTGKSCQPA